MATLQATGIADLVATTLNQLGRLKFSDVATDYNRTIALKRTVRKTKMQFDGGPEVQFNLMMDHNNSARFTGLYAVDNVDVTNVMQIGRVPWRHVTWNWGIDRREVAMNSTPQKIVDLVQARRIAALASAVVLFERRFWRSPSPTDEENPYGMPYWIVKNNTEGFNGGVATGFTTVAGLSPMAFPRWRNWTAQYSAVTQADLVRKIRRAMWETDFEPVVEGMPTYNTGDEVVLYTNYVTLAALEDLALSNNDRVGFDLAAADGQTTIMRAPIVAVKELGDDTTDPVYGINWGEMKTMGLRGEWMVEIPVDPVGGQHTVSATFTDCSFNWFCRNRRRNFVIAKDTLMP